MEHLFRTQISLSQNQMAILRKLHMQTGKSMAELIREAVDRTFKPSIQHRKIKAVSKITRLNSKAGLQDWDTLEKQIMEQGS